MDLAIPTIETERLTLRPFREADVTVLLELLQDPDVVRYVGDRRVPTLQETWRSIAGWLGHWAMRGYGQWAIEERNSGRMIGRAGIINPAEWPGPEIGYLLGRAWWGHGYATEAASAAMSWGGESLRGQTTLLGTPVLTYGIGRGEWKARQT